MEDRRAFLIDGCWKLDGVEDQHATRVVQAIRSRRYVNQKEIAEALGIVSWTPKMRQVAKVEPCP